MVIITFAHPAEAQFFIKRKHTQKVDFYFPGLYRDDAELLLLTGEGIQMATIRLSAVCTYFGNKIKRIINFGIAGSLSASLQVNQIYGIQQVHHELTGSQGYPSFPCMETHSKIDCITAMERVTSDDYAKRLSAHAQAVDRELWGIGSVASAFKIPFKSYKLISDIAGETTDSTAIINRAQEFSKHLFDFYKSLSITRTDTLEDEMSASDK